MDPRFDDYGKTVCQFLPYATGREKKGIQAELSAHMADHAQALLDAGYDETHARDIALKAMGDPQEVGQALDREYPLRWLLLSRVLLALVVVMVLLIWQSFPGSLYASLVARIHPFDSGFHSTLLDDDLLTPTDYKVTLPNGDVVWVYATAVTWDDYDGYIGHVYAAHYNQNPFRDPYFGIRSFTFTTQDDREALYQGGGGGGSSGAYYWHSRLSGLAPGDILVGRYQQYGADLTLTIPLPWEEVTQP